MQIAVMMCAAALAVAGPGGGRGAGASNLGNPVLDHCLVSIKDEVQVPAQEAGVLVELTAVEGAQVKEGESLGHVDDSERQIQKNLAVLEQQAAREKAENDVNVRYADAAAGVAQAEYEQAVEANQKVKGTFPQAEIRRLKLAWQRSVLQIEQSQVEQRQAGFASKAKIAEVEAAENNIRRRQFVAPLGGEVVAVFKHVGEWAQPGDPVYKIVRFDTLRVEGFLNASDFDPAEIAKRPVIVEVELARGRRERFTGQIVHVSSLVQAGGDYRVWAEVANRRENDQWVMRPGVNAVMTIQVK